MERNVDAPGGEGPYRGGRRGWSVDLQHRKKSLMATSTAAHTSGGQEESAQHGGLHMPAVRIPSGTAGRVLWWGGLAAVAAFGVVDWPVAVLVAAGSWVAEQSAKSATKPPKDDREAGHSRRPAGEGGKPPR